MELSIKLINIQFKIKESKERRGERDPECAQIFFFILFTRLFYFWHLIQLF